MNRPHINARRLVVAVMLVAGIGLVATLGFSRPAAARSASGATVSYYHGTKLLGSTAVTGALDVVWKNGACSNGYASPPVAFTWTNTSTGVASAPVMGPCGHVPGSMSLFPANDFECHFWPWYPTTDCSWTYKKGSGTTTSSAKIANPGKATVGNLYLFKRTALYAYLISPGKPNKKISVPKGTDTITFAQGG